MSPSFPFRESRSFLRAAFLLTALLVAHPARASDKIWSYGGSNNLASTAGNWIGGVAPVGGDHLIFGSTTPAAMCAWDLGVTVSSVDFTGTFSSSVVLSSDLLVSSSVVSGGSAAGVIDLNGKALSIGVNLIADNLSFTSSVAGSSVVFEGAGGGVASKASGALHFENLVSSKAVGSTMTVTANMILDGGLSILEGALDMSGVRLDLAGSVFLGGYLGVQGSTVALFGTTPQSFAGGAGSGGGPGGDAGVFGALFVQNATTVTLPGIDIGVLVDTTPASTLAFVGGDPFSIGALTVAGGGLASRVLLLTDNPGTQAALTVGSASVDYAYVKDLDASGGAGILATHALDGGNNANWTFLVGGGNLVWSGGGLDALASNGANWSGGIAPAVQDFVTFGSAGSAKPCTWDLAVQVASVSVVGGYASAITLANDLQVLYGVRLAASGAASLVLAGHAIRDEGDWTANGASVTGVAGSSVSFEGSGSSTLSSSVGGLLPLPGLSIAKTGSAAVTAATGLKIAGGFSVLSGTFTAGANRVDLGGALSATGGYLSVSAATVSFSGSGDQSATFSSPGLVSPVAALYAQNPATTTFSAWNAGVLIATQPSSGLIFATGASTMTIGTLQVVGQALGTRITMSGPGSLAVTGSADVEFASVSGLEASSGMTISALYSLDGGGNANWVITGSGGAQRVWSYGGGSANASVAGNWSGGIAPSTGDFVLFGATTPTAGCTWDLPMQISSLSISGAFSATVTLSTNLSVANGVRLDAAGGSLDPAGLAVYDFGGWEARSGALTGGVAASSVVFEGGAPVTVAASGAGPLAFGNLLFSKASTGTVTLASDLSLSGAFDMEGGSVTAGANRLDVGGDVRIFGGYLDVAVATFVFSGSSPQQTAGNGNGNISTIGGIFVQNPTTTTLVDLQADVFVATRPSATVLFNNPGGGAATFGSFTASGQSVATRVRLVGGAAGVPLTVNGSVSLDFVYAQDLDASGGTTMTAAHSADGGGNTNWSISTVGGALVIWDKTGGDSLASNPANWLGGSVPTAGDFVLFGATTPASPCTWDLSVAVDSFSVSGAYASTVTLTTDLQLTGAGIRLDAAAAAVDLNGRAAFLTGDWNAGATKLFSTVQGSSVVFTGSGDSLVSSLVAAPAGFEVFVSSKDPGGRVLAQSDLTIDGDFIILSGTFTAPGRTMNLHQDLILNGGYMDVSGTTVAFTGTIPQALTGNGSGEATSFAGLDIQTVQDVTIPDVEAGILVATTPNSRVYLASTNGPLVLGSLLINGGSTGSRVILSSTSASVPSQLKVLGNVSVDFVRAKGIDASAGQPITANTSVDDGGNVNWNFVNTGFGIQVGDFTADFISSVTLTWTHNFNPGQVFYAELSTDSYATLVQSSVTENSYATFTGLVPNTLYDGRVSTGTLSVYTDAGTTVTLAEAPASPAVFAAFYSSVTLTWSTGANPGGTEFIAAASSDSFVSVAASSTVYAGSATIPGLLADTTYSLAVAARNSGGVLTAYAGPVSTVTAAAVPAAAAAPVADSATVVVSWGTGGNGTGTYYDSEISTDSFSTLVDSTRTTSLTATYSGLTADTTYQLRVRALSRAGVPTAYLALSPATTLLPVPGSAGVPFPGVGVSSVAAAWTTSGSGLTYSAEVSTDSFTTVNFTSATANLSALFGTGGAGAALASNTTFYARVRAASAGNSSAYLTIGSTITLPADPASPAASDLQTTSGTWAWGSGGNSAGTSYSVELSTDSFATLVNSASPAAAQVVFNGLKANTTYQLRVAASGFDGYRTGFVSAPSSSTLPSAPAAGGEIFISSASLAWTDSNSPVVTFAAEASTDSFATVSVASATPGLLADLVGLVPNTTYQFRVRASGNGGGSSASTTTTAMTGTFVPSLSSFTASSTGAVTAAWLANGNPAGVLYEVQLSTDGFATLARTSVTANGNASFGGLQADTTHQLRVRSRNAAGAYSAYDSIAATTTAVDQPAALALSGVGPNDVVANWGAGGNGPLTIYEVQVTTGTFPVYNSAFTGAALTYDFSGLAVNTTYAFQVRAIGGDGGTSAFLSLGTTQTLLLSPGVPAQPVTAVGVSSAAVSWTNGGNGAGIAYEADLSTDNFASVILTSATASLSALFGTGGAGSPLSSDATYYFRVRAAGGSGNSAYVSLGSTVTYAADPAALAAVNAATSTATLDWAANGNAATTLYEAQVSSDSFASVTAATRTTALSALFSGLESNATQELRVRALGIQGPTAFVSLSTWTSPAAPVSPAAAAVSATSVTVTWGALNAAGSPYEAVLSTQPPLVYASSTVYGGSAGFMNLLANVTYYAQVRAFLPDGTGPGFVSAGSTATPADTPGAALNGGIGVSTGSWTWGIGLNGPTTYQIEVSTLAGFVPADASALVYASSAAGAGAILSSLVPNATHYVRVSALGITGASGYAAASPIATLPAVPASAPLVSVGTGSAVAGWTDGGNGAGTQYEARVSTDGFATYNDAVTTVQTQAGFGGLTPNTNYEFEVRVLGWTADSAFVALPSTTTLPVAPGSAASTFTAVGLSSVTVSWTSGGNLAGTVYRAEVSTDAFATIVVSSLTKSLTALFGTGGQGTLTPDTAYLFRVAATSGTSSSPETVLGSTVTLPAEPLTLSVSAVSTGSVTATWLGNGNPADTQYLAQASTDSFTTVSTSSAVATTTAVISGLAGDSTYYLRVRAVGRGGATSLYVVGPTTATVAATPSSLVAAFDLYAATLTWSSGGNSTGTVYEAQASTDSFATASFVGTATGTAAYFTFLIPNTTFFLRARAIGLTGSTAFAAAAASATVAAVPAGPSAGPLGVSSVTVSWSSGGNSTGTVYDAEVSTDASFASAVLSSVTANLSADYAGLTGNATYYARVRALQWNGGVTAYATAAATVTLTAQPGSAEPVSVTSGSIVAAWTSGGNAPDTVYGAEISTDGFSSVNATAFTTATQAGFGGLLANTVYLFRVQAFARDGSFTPYTILPATSTLLTSPGAGSPAIVAVEVSSVAVAWTAGGNGPGTQYLARVSTDSFSTIVVSSLTENLGATFGSGGEGTLRPDTVYQFQVFATSGAALSASVPLGSTVTLPAQPGALSFVSASTDSIAYDWGAAGNPSDTQYQAQVSSDGFTVVFSSAVAATTATISGLSPDAFYAARVRSIGRGGAVSAFKTGASFATNAVTPTSPAADYGVTTATVTWSGGKNPATTAYTVEYSSTSFVQTFSSTGIHATSDLLSGLTPNTTYQFRVAANAVDGTTTPYATAATSATAAAAPIGLVPVLTGTGTAAASWGSGGNSVETVYTAEISTDAAFSTLTASSVTANLTAGFSGLGPNTTYYERVKALQWNGGASAYSVSATTATAPVPPTSAATVAVTSGSIVAGWGSGGNPFDTQYDLQITSDSFATVNATVRVANTLGGFGGLQPSATYELRVRAVGRDGTVTGFVALPAAGTFLLPPLAAASTFTAVGVSSVAVAWLDGGNSPGTVFRAQVSTDSFLTVSFSSDTKNLAATFGTGGAGAALQPDATYEFRVETYGGSNSSEFLILGSTATRAFDPGAPAFTSASSGTLTAAWTANGNPADTSYRSELSSTSFASVLASNSGAGLTSSFTGLTPDTTYQLRVRAVSRAGAANDFVAAAATATTAAPPESVTAGFGFGTAFLSWTTAGNPAAVSYDSEASTDSFATFVSSASGTSPVSFFNNLAVNTTYYLRVRAVGFSGPSAFVAAAPGATSPAKPAAPAASASGTTATMSWGANGNPAGTVYDAELSTDSFTGVAASSFTANLSATFSGLESNATYYLRVRTAGWSAYSIYAAVESTTTPVVAPASAPTASVSSATIVTAWSANGNAAGTLYDAQISTDAFGTVNASSRTEALTAGFDGLVSGLSYDFRVRAVGRDGTSTAFVSLPSTTTFLTPPAAVATPFPSVGISSLTVAWSAGAAPPGTTYRVELSTDSFATVSVASATANLTALFGTGGEGPALPVNILYAARVYAFFGGNQSSALLVGSTATYALAPSGTMVVAVTSQTAVLDWSAAGNPEPGTSYQVQYDLTPAFASPTTVTASTSGATVAGLGFVSTNYFRVRAINGAGAATGFDATVSTVTAGPGPTQPGTPAGTTMGVSSVTWTWSAASGASSYELFVGTVAPALIHAQSSTTFVQTGLGPNSSTYLLVAGVNGNGEGPQSSPGLGWTLANPPSGTAVSAVYATSATLTWGLNGNPSYTVSDVQRSPTGAIYTTVATGVTGASYTDFGLLGCTLYYYRVRNANGTGATTAYDSVVNFITSVSTPLAPTGLTATPQTGGRIALSWTPSPTVDINRYTLYSDGGSGILDYGTPYAALTSTETSFVTPPLTSSAAYSFALRATNQCGNEEKNTATRALSPAVAALAPVSAAVSSPPGGRRVDGDRVTVSASQATGALTQWSSVLFQYRPSGSGSWTDIVAAVSAHPNPALSAPYYTQWDVTLLAPGAYDLRAVAYDLSSSSDPAPAATTIQVDPTSPDVREVDIGGGRSRKDQVVYSGIDNAILVGGLTAGDPLTRLVLPAGALGASTATISVYSMPDLTGISTTAFGAQSAGLYARVDLSNGQTTFGGGRTASLTLSYPDADDDGVVDGTGLSASNLRFWSYNTLTNAWQQDLTTSFDPSKRTVTGATPHFSLFGVFAGAAAGSSLDQVRAYPVPYKPNGRDPDEGRPYAAGVSNTGIIFDGVPSNTRVMIYTVDGRLVADLSSNGSTIIQWDAKNGAGRDVATGGYFAVISAPGLRSVVRRLSIIR